MLKLLRIRFMKFILPVGLTFAVMFSGTAAAYSAEADIDYINGVIDMIEDEYSGTVTDSQLLEGTLRGLLGNLDPYTTYYTNDEAQDFIGSMEGAYAGVGISLEASAGYHYVIDVFKDSPAEISGILPGDKIIAINGITTAGRSLELITTMLRGDFGTTVSIKIMRTSSENPLTFLLTRDMIRLNPVIYDVRNGIGYIKLKSFNYNAERGLTEALLAMDSREIDKIILDLRGNPGGDVGQAVAVAEKFVTEGVITYIDFKSEIYEDEEYRSNLTTSEYKLVVLVDEDSASAAEIVAGAIQDRDAGTLVGSKTFGKAKVQRIIPMLTPEAAKIYAEQTGEYIVDINRLIELHGIYPERSELQGYTKMTIGYYYTPNGRMIDETGILPDIIIPDPAEINGVDVLSAEKLEARVKPGLGFRSIDVYNAEIMLKALGYDVAAPDTLSDDKTFRAIAKFQKDSGLYPYGVLDFTTQRALNNKFFNWMSEYDRQYFKAVEVLKSY